jgi:hypothetical protein
MNGLLCRSYLKVPTRFFEKNRSILSKIYFYFLKTYGCSSNDTVNRIVFSVGTILERACTSLDKMSLTVSEATQGLTEEQVADLKEAFAMFDINGDGRSCGHEQSLRGTCSVRVYATCPMSCVAVIRVCCCRSPERCDDGKSGGTLAGSVVWPSCLESCSTRLIFSISTLLACRNYRTA